VLLSMICKYPFTGRSPWPRRQPVLELEEGCPGHGGSLSWRWRMGALATEAACPGDGGWPLWPRRLPVLELEDGRSGHGGCLSWRWRKAGLTVTVQVPLQAEFNWEAFSTKIPSTATHPPHIKYPLLTFKL
jgi:hypothetical protein